MIVLPIPVGIACGLSLGNKRILHRMIINKNNKYRKQYQKDQQTNKSFDKLYSKSSQDNVIEEMEYESLYKIFIRYLDE